MKRPFATLGISLWILAAIFAFFPSWPHIYYRLSPQTSKVLAQTLSETATPPSIQIPPIHTPPTPPTLPPTDPSLPKENGLIIETLGVRGQIHEGDDWQTILKEGIWRVPDFGTPDDTDPIILAAHRWGYLNWTNQFRYLNSFYNLPKLNLDDQIKIVWNQREYLYQVYAQETSEKISDYSADLILYTCQLWNSPIRIIKYAKLIN